jgi:hypothetical protein
MYSRISSAELNFFISPAGAVGTVELRQPLAMTAVSTSTSAASVMRESILRDIVDQDSVHRKR